MEWMVKTLVMGYLISTWYKPNSRYPSHSYFGTCTESCTHV